MPNEDPQNPSERRAYFVRPKENLAQRLESIGMAVDVDALCQPTVVMTEALPFEGKLEGYRKLILKRCKEAFVEVSFNTDHCQTLRSERPSLARVLLLQSPSISGGLLRK